MKRFATAAIAATTAFSLAVVPAQAGETSSGDEVTSSVAALTLLQIGKIGAAENEADAKKAIAEAEFGLAALQSSCDNDREKDWPIGRTFDIIWGSLLGVAALGGLAFLALNAK